MDLRNLKNDSIGIDKSPLNLHFTICLADIALILLIVMIIRQHDISRLEDITTYSIDNVQLSDEANDVNCVIKVYPNNQFHIWIEKGNETLKPRIDNARTRYEMVRCLISYYQYKRTFLNIAILSEAYVRFWEAGELYAIILKTAEDYLIKSNISLILHEPPRKSILELDEEYFVIVKKAIS